ncbi:BCCT family transporter [Halobacterium yunchengense]|uniref:BCCT family transporter n=1 Tax=Halobacterium yunchengense TaxID=3108497 RepID=UPI00300AE9BC
MTDGDDQTTGQTSDGLQVELFHPESDREPGDTNIQRWGFDVHPVVFPLAAVIIALFVAVTLLMGSDARTVYTNVFDFINKHFGWFYIFAVNVFIIALVYFALSKYGKIRLGGVEADQEFSTFAWMAMLFSAGMGIGLMFFSVAEPMWHLGTGGGNLFGAEPGSGAAAEAAMGVTFFHWGFHPWAVYGLVALGLGFFSFNRGLPLTFRSVFYPLLGDRIYDWPGHVIDLVTVFATLFGLATSLGLGAQQINVGLNRVTETLAGSALLDVGTVPQIGIIAVITAIATLSVAAGLESGVKRLSTINVYLMVLFLGFILVVGPTLYLLDSIVQSTGFYLQNLAYMSFFTESFMGEGVGGFPDGGYANWQHFWTVFYWGWWIAWSPFVGLFIARISRGRTVRQMVLGVLLIPTAFSFVWLGSFGGAAIYAENIIGSGLYETLTTAETAGQARAMFGMLESYPVTTLTSIVAITLVATFFITSSDSGSLVVDHLTSGGKHDVPRTQRVFWAVTEGTVAAAILWGGGSAALNALQTAAIATGLPFAAILLLMVYTVYLGLDSEYQILQSEEFRERISEISSEDDIEVDRSGTDVVTDITDSSETGSGD